MSYDLAISFNRNVHTYSPKETYKNFHCSVIHRPKLGKTKCLTTVGQINCDVVVWWNTIQQWKWTGTICNNTDGSHGLNNVGQKKLVSKIHIISFHLCNVQMGKPNPCWKEVEWWLSLWGWWLGGVRMGTLDRSPWSFLNEIHRASWTCR